MEPAYGYGLRLLEDGKADVAGLVPCRYSAKGIPAIAAQAGRSSKRAAADDISVGK